MVGSSVLSAKEQKTPTTNVKFLQRREISTISDTLQNLLSKLERLEEEFFHLKADKPPTEKINLQTLPSISTSLPPFPPSSNSSVKNQHTSMHPQNSSKTQTVIRAKSGTRPSAQKKSSGIPR